MAEEGGIQLIGDFVIEAFGLKYIRVSNYAGHYRRLGLRR